MISSYGLHSIFAGSRTTAGFEVAFKGFVVASDCVVSREVVFAVVDMLDCPRDSTHWINTAMNAKIGAPFILFWTFFVGLDQK